MSVYHAKFLSLIYKRRTLQEEEQRAQRLCHLCSVFRNITGWEVLAYTSRLIVVFQVICCPSDLFHKSLIGEQLVLEFLYRPVSLVQPEIARIDIYICVAKVKYHGEMSISPNISVQILIWDSRSLCDSHKVSSAICVEF